MATQKMNESFTYARNAGADLSGKLHYLTKIDTDGDIVLAGNGELVLGQIYEAAAENQPVTVQFGAIGKAIVGAGGITAGAKCAADALGKMVPATSGEYAFGVACDTGVENAIVAFIFVPGGRVA